MHQNLIDIAIYLVFGILVYSLYRHIRKTGSTASEPTPIPGDKPETPETVHNLNVTSPGNALHMSPKTHKEQQSQPIRIPDLNLTLTQEQSSILKEALDPNDKTPLFITGPAGTGKSVLIHALRYYLDKNNIPYAVVAPTGLAALHIEGQTIHRFFGFKPRLVRYNNPNDIRIFKKEVKQKMINELEYLIIDEISMARADIIDAIDLSMRKNRKTNKPFGGVKLIMVGDVLQLEPVVEDDDDLKQYLSDTWQSPFFFHAHVWEKIHFKIVQLTQIMRQHDKQFINYLMELRKGNLEYLELLNILVREQKQPELIEHIRKQGTRLTFTNSVARNINMVELNRLSGSAREYIAQIIGDFKPKDAPVPQTIALKPGAKVILMANSPKNDYINGDMGIVTALWENTIEVELSRDGKTVSVSPFTWESISYEYDSQAKQIVPRVTGKFIQMPLRLAWAITIHKSQGLTLDAVTIETRRQKAFAHGQMYVALTRTRRADDLYYDRPLNKADFIIRSEVLRFMEHITETQSWSLQSRLV